MREPIWKQKERETLEEEAARLYPSSEVLRAQWVRKTKALVESGRHAQFNGGFPHSDEEGRRI